MRIPHPHLFFKSYTTQVCMYFCTVYVGRHFSLLCQTVSTVSGGTNPSQITVER